MRKSTLPFDPVRMAYSPCHMCQSIDDSPYSDEVAATCLTQGGV